jgi:ribosomal protein S18 acetylase RimI-like enzyme
LRARGFLVATIGDEVVGFITAFKNAFGNNYNTNKKIGKIQAIHVKREHRQRGIATSLMKEAQDYLKSCGCTIILAETDEKNTKSIKMLQKQGFKERGKLVNLMKES